jgi:hypothetical protein
MKNEESMFESQVGEMGYRTGANFGQKYQINQAIQEEDEQGDEDQYENT